MKSKKDIQERIAEIKKERKKWLDKQDSYTFSRKEKIEGSRHYGMLQEQEANCNRRIRELEWVLE